MSELSYFLKSNKIENKTVKYAASENFIDPKTKKPLEWEIRPLRSGEADQLRKECSSYKKNGQRIVDEERFNRLMAVRCTIFPDLNDKELQDSYNVLGAENLITEMLDKDGDYQLYVAEVTKISGYTKNMEELIEEAKN